MATNDIAQQAAQDIFGILRELPADPSRECLQALLARRAQEILDRTSLPKRMEHTVFAREGGFGIWDRPCCALLFSADYGHQEADKVNMPGHNRLDLYAAELGMETANLLEVRFKVESRPADPDKPPKPNDPVVRHCIGRISELGEPDLAAFLAEDPSAAGAIRRALQAAIDAGSSASAASQQA